MHETHAALLSQIWTPQNGAHRKPFPAATPSLKLAPRPRSKQEKRTARSAWETRTVAAADGVSCARVGWEINFLLTFETAPSFCVYPVYIPDVLLLTVGPQLRPHTATQCHNKSTDFHRCGLSSSEFLVSLGGSLNVVNIVVQYMWTEKGTHDMGRRKLTSKGLHNLYSSPYLLECAAYEICRKCSMHQEDKKYKKIIWVITGTWPCGIYRVSQEECARLREGVPYVKVYRYNPKHLCPKLNRYGDNGQRSLKLWQLLHTYLITKYILKLAGICGFCNVNICT